MCIWVCIIRKYKPQKKLRPFYIAFSFILNVLSIGMCLGKKYIFVLICELNISPKFQFFNFKCSAFFQA